MRRYLADGSVEMIRRVSPRTLRLGPPQGTFSTGEMLRHGDLPGELLLERQDFAFIPADAMRVRSGLNQHRHQPWPIFWTRHAEARLAGSTLVLMDQRKRACLEAMYIEHHPADPAYRTVWLPRPTRLAGSWTSIVSRWCCSTNFYHWFTDGLSRLALLDRLPPGLGVLVPAGLRPFQLDTLRWLGLEGRYRETSERHLCVENYYFTAPTAMTGCTNPYAAKFLREKFLPHADATFQGPDKFYLLRRGKTRGVLNEAELIAFLERRGWTAIDPEALQLAQQIKLFAGARAVCGLHGAGLTNMLWCRPACVIIELMADNFLNGCYESISASLEVRHQILVFPGDAQWRIRVDLERLARVLPE
jgi:capsular polysaccharide biosynthesis protein